MYVFIPDCNGLLCLQCCAGDCFYVPLAKLRASVMAGKVIIFSEILFVMNDTELSGYGSTGRLYIPDLLDFLSRDCDSLHLLKGTLLCFCRHGSATIRINYETYRLRQHDILAIRPTHIFSIDEWDDSAQLEAILYTDKFWAAISHSLDYRLIKVVERNPHARIPAATRQEVYDLLDLVCRHDVPAEGAGEVEHWVAAGLAFSLLVLLVSVIVKADVEAPHLTTRKEELTREFFELLSQYFESQRAVTFYADRLCVTPKHLSAMVREVTGLSIREWINDVTVLNIKRRLMTTTDSIESIAEATGFDSASSFVRFFRIRTGSTPARFRAQMSGVRR